MGQCLDAGNRLGDGRGSSAIVDGVFQERLLIGLGATSNLREILDNLPNPEHQVCDSRPRVCEPGVAAVFESKADWILSANQSQHSDYGQTREINEGAAVVIARQNRWSGQLSPPAQIMECFGAPVGKAQGVRWPSDCGLVRRCFGVALKLSAALANRDVVRLFKNARILFGGNTFDRQRENFAIAMSAEHCVLLGNVKRADGDDSKAVEAKEAWTAGKVSISSRDWLFKAAFVSSNEQWRKARKKTTYLTFVPYLENKYKI